MAKYTVKLTEDQSKVLNTLLNEEGWESYEVNHSAFAYKTKKCSVVFYNTGNLFVDGESMESFVLEVLEPKITKEAIYGRDEELNPQYYESHAGVDESGKGDFFGPLVSACVIADGDAIRYWVQNGLKESKAASDKKVLELAAMIEATPNVSIGISYYDMQTYNDKYKSISDGLEKNKRALNYQLADLHADAIRQALAKKFVSWGMLDQFRDEDLVQQRITDIKGFELKMETKAERDPVVAAASIIARAQFLKELNKLSRALGVKLKKGASAAVESQAVELANKYGKDELSKCAKCHFVTFEKVIKKLEE